MVAGGVTGDFMIAQHPQRRHRAVLGLLPAVGAARRPGGDSGARARAARDLDGAPAATGRATGARRRRAGVAGAVGGDRVPARLSACGFSTSPTHRRSAAPSTCGSAIFRRWPATAAPPTPTSSAGNTRLIAALDQRGTPYTTTQSFSGRMIEVTLRPAALAALRVGVLDGAPRAVRAHRTRAADRAARDLVPGLPLCRPGGAGDRRAAHLARAQHQAHPRGEHAALSLRGLDLRVDGRPVARRHRQPGDGRAAGAQAGAALQRHRPGQVRARRRARPAAYGRSWAGPTLRRWSGCSASSCLTRATTRSSTRPPRFAPRCPAPGSSSSAHSRTRPTRLTCARASPPRD